MNINKKKLSILGGTIILGIILVYSYMKTNDGKSNKFNIDKAKLEIQIDSNENITIPIKNIPFLYTELTQGMNLEDDTEIGLLKFQFDRIQPEVIYADGKDYYILINYNCGVKLCNYMLIKYNDTNLESIYLASGLFKDVKVSTDRDKLSINFIQTEGHEVFDNIVIVGINDLEIIETPNLPKEYTYVLDSYEWNENKLYINYMEKGSKEIKTISSE